MTQPNLWDIPEPAPYQAHSPTSRQAAEEIRPKAATLRDLVLRFIRGCGEHGATDEEICLGLNMNPSTARPRRRELEQRGLVRDSGRTRKTASGRSAVVWEATK